MKDLVLHLIEDDIRLTRITKALSAVAIETTEISTNNYVVIAALMQFQHNADFSDAYYQWLEKESDPEKVYAFIQQAHAGSPHTLPETESPE